MKKLSLLLSILFFAGLVSGQKIKKQIVYLKNGSVVKGNLVDLDENKMSVQSAKNTWVFDRADIDTIVGTVSSGDLQQGYPSWFMRTSFGVLLGSEENSKTAPFSCDLSANFRVFQRFYAGAGLGVDFLDETYTPVFANLEYHFRSSEITPFVGVKLGYLVPTTDKVSYQSSSFGVYDANFNYYPYYSSNMEPKGGFMVNPTIGFISYMNAHIGFSLAVGYRYCGTKLEGENNHTLETDYNRLSIHLGILFN